MSTRPGHPRCPRHGRQVPPDTVCALCRADALADGRERPYIDPRPRCPEHDVALAPDGTCTSCAGDHRAGEHRASENGRPSAWCPLCRQPATPTTWTPSTVLEGNPA